MKPHEIERQLRALSGDTPLALNDSGSFGLVFLSSEHAFKVAKDGKHQAQTIKNEIAVHQYLIAQSDVETGRQWIALMLKTLTELGIDNVTGLSMPYIRGMNAERYYTTRQFMINNSRHLHSIASGVSHGVAWLHDKGVVLRDLDPSNVIISGNHPTIIDLGAAVYKESDKQISVDQSLIGIHESAMAPELLGLHSVKPRCGKDVFTIEPTQDIFSYGAFIVYIATGEFDECEYEDNRETSIRMKCERLASIDPLPKHARHLNPELCYLIRMCLAFKPEVRPSADEIITTLTNNAVLFEPSSRQRTTRTVSSHACTP